EPLAARAATQDHPKRTLSSNLLHEAPDRNAHGKPSHGVLSAGKLGLLHPALIAPASAECGRYSRRGPSGRRPTDHSSSASVAGWVSGIDATGDDPPLIGSCRAG